jgi:dCMP deaminase
MSRITRPMMYMQIARIASLRSTCFRLNVGCVIVRDNRIVVSLGYNGAPPGEPHCSGNDCPGRYHCNRTLHAERNALDHLHYTVKEDKIFDLYTTHSPCWTCCRQIEWSPIRRVFFETEFRETAHLSQFKDQWELYQLTPAGYIVDYFSKEVVELA